MSADTLHRLWEVQDELAAVRAELSALKARRCDGCAYFSLESKGQGECWSDVYETTAALPLVFIDHSCAAWTEKP